MNIDALLGAKDFTVETSYTVLGILDDRDFFFSFSFHVDHICRANGITKTAAGAFIEIDVNDHSLAYSALAAGPRFFPKFRL